MSRCSRCGEENAAKARFCWNCGAPLGDAAHSAGAEVRKTVTVLFMDIVGSTELGERVDPESLRALMTRYFDEIRTVVEHHGGTLEKYIGDAVMAVFGVPTLHEDDALRAARAALEIRERLSALGALLEQEGRQPLTWRTGINTGEVVAGDAGAGQRFVSGDAVNVAARLEQAAAVGEILLGQAAFALVRGEVQAEPVPNLAAKGKSEPLSAYRLLRLGAESTGRRLDAPMVGRRRQRRLLEDAFEEVAEDHLCHLFTILGSAGVGKSRLVREFLAGVAEQATTLQGRCLSYGEGITYWPIAEVIRQAADLHPALEEGAARAHLADLLAGQRDGAQVVQRLGEIVGLWEGQASREEIFWAVRTLFQWLARTKPIVVVIDDVHWAEPTLLDLIDNLAETITDSPVLLICVARRELLDTRPSWGGGKAHATSVTLERLNAQESRDLVQSLLGRAELGQQLAQRVTDAAEGNPLFVEEMLRMLIDDGRLAQHGGTWVADGDLAQLNVPPNIQVLLAARIDGLEPADRQVLERAAVEGHSFHRAAVVEMSPPELSAEVDARLASLSRREMIRPADAGPADDDDLYRFRHLLIRDAAYAAIPKSARSEMHGRLADWLRRRAGDRLAEYEEILGYHYQQAHRYRTEVGLLDGETLRVGRSGAEHLGAAGQRALDRGDTGAATKLLASAGDLLPAGDPLRTRLRVELALALRMAANLQGAAELLPEVIEEAHQAGDEAGAAYADMALAVTLSAMGELKVVELVQRCENALATLREHGDERAIDRVVLELATGHFYAGRAGLAESLLLERMAMRPELEHSQSYREWLATILVAGPTDARTAAKLIDGLRVAGGSRIGEAAALFYLGALDGFSGNFDEGRRLILEGATIMREMGRDVMVAIETASWLSEVELLAGNRDEAWRVASEGFEVLMRAGEHGFASSVAGQLAGICIERGDVDEALEYAQLAQQVTAEDDFESQARSLAAQGRIAARRGAGADALALVSRAAELMRETDYLEERGQVQLAVAEVELLVGDRTRAVSALQQALADFQAKGFDARVAQARARLAELGVEPTGA